MFPPAGNWPQRVSEVLLPTWPGAAAGGGPSAPALSAIETECTAKPRTSKGPPFVMQFPPEESKASEGRVLPSAQGDITHCGSLTRCKGFWEREGGKEPPLVKGPRPAC